MRVTPFPGIAMSTSGSNSASVPRARRRRVGRGLSIVEMMVGITIGLFILAAASMVATSQLTGNRDAMVRVQMQQDLRVIADMMAGSIARSAFYRGVERRVLPTASPASYGTVYDGVTVGGTPGAGQGSSVEFSASTDEIVQNIAGLENDTVDFYDQLGFRWDGSDGTVSMWLREGGWQVLSDPQLMRVTGMQVDVIERVVPTPCGYRCESASATNPACVWTTKTREFTIRIDAVAVSNPAIRRSIDQVVRARNPIVSAPTHVAGC